MSYFVRMILLRNCGRFLNLASDFGSNYKTHNFVSSEALYAGLTREQTRIQPKFIDLQNDRYDFTNTFDIKKIPIWFTPGVFVDRNNFEKLLKKSRKNSDTNQFNVLDEDYPKTGANRDYQKEERFYRGKRPHYCPTYGSIESILPGQLMRTFAISKNKSLMDNYYTNQVFLLGKKRTMFQIMKLSEIVETELIKKGGDVIHTQIEFDELKKFSSSTICAATNRYFLVTGNYADSILYAITSEVYFGFPTNLCRILE